MRYNFKTWAGERIESFGHGVYVVSEASNPQMFWGLLSKKSERKWLRRGERDVAEILGGREPGNIKWPGPLDLEVKGRWDMNCEGDSIVEISSWMNGAEEGEKVRGRHQESRSSLTELDYWRTATILNMLKLKLLKSKSIVSKRTLRDRQDPKLTARS